MKKIKQKIVAIIPAKERSTRIPGKNLKDLAGKPMLAYIIETAVKVKKMGLLDRVIVTTESDKIAKVAKQYGAEVPFRRPLSLCEDHTGSPEIVRHAVSELEKKDDYVPDYVLLIYPTSPLLKPERIVEAVNLALARNSDGVISGTLERGHFWMEVDGGYRRFYPIKPRNSQFEVPLAKENGAIYLIKTSLLSKQLVADKTDFLFMEDGENVDVDYPADFAKVEQILLANKK